jgi:hypothetical protein
VDQLETIKDELNKIKMTEKDALLIEVNKKIEHLESVVRQALEEVNEEKVAKRGGRGVGEEARAIQGQPLEERGPEEREPELEKGNVGEGALNKSMQSSKELFTENKGMVAAKNFSPAPLNPILSKSSNMSRSNRH